MTDLQQNNWISFLVYILVLYSFHEMYVQLPNEILYICSTNILNIKKKKKKKKKPLWSTNKLALQSTVFMNFLYSR